MPGYATQPNAWAVGRGALPYPRGWFRGFFTGQRKMTAKAYFMGPRAREAVANRAPTVEPYWHVMNFPTLAARDSGTGQIVPSGDFALVALIGTSGAAAGFQSQLYQTSKNRDGFRFSRQGVNQANIFGTAQRPCYLRKPYFVSDLRSILATVQAAHTSGTSSLQLVLFGYKRRTA